MEIIKWRLLKFFFLWSLVLFYFTCTSITSYRSCVSWQILLTVKHIFYTRVLVPLVTMVIHCFLDNRHWPRRSQRLYTESDWLFTELYILNKRLSNMGTVHLVVYFAIQVNLQKMFLYNLRVTTLAKYLYFKFPNYFIILYTIFKIYSFYNTDAWSFSTFPFGFWHIEI